MLNIGCHLSNAKGYLAMGRTALSIGASTCQFFTRNPRGGAAKALDPADMAAFAALAAEHALGPFLAHAPYTLNPCAAEEKTRRFALEVMRDDLARLTLLPGTMYNFHPGSHVGQGVEEGVERIAAQLNAVLTPQTPTLVLLETMAGKGSEVGGDFGELRGIIDRVACADKLGVCLDTCHVHDAGYDIVDGLDGVLEEFDRVIGLGRLRAIHLNDSLNARGSRKDRHAKIGQGQIGLDALARVINHPSLRGLPFYLETPNELPGYAEEIAQLRRVWRE
ncbi:deoxyribonuclease IV [Humidesulfovibrio idahonensis]